MSGRAGRAAGHSRRASRGAPPTPASETIASLLGRLGSPSPSAGGGAAAALTGATAAALVAMVCGIAARHAPDGGALAAIGADARQACQRLTALIEQDVEACRAVFEAGPPDGAAALRRALVKATEVPLEVAAIDAALLERCGAIVASARSSTLADLGTAGALSRAALEAAVLTARANLARVEDPAFVRQTTRQLRRSLEQGAAAHERMSGTIARRMSARARRLD